MSSMLPFQGWRRNGYSHEEIQLCDFMRRAATLSMLPQLDTSFFQLISTDQCRQDVGSNN